MMARFLLALIELGIIICFPAVHSHKINDLESLSTNNREYVIINDNPEKSENRGTNWSRENKYTTSEEAEAFQSSLNETQDENKKINKWDFPKLFKLVMSFVTKVEDENISLPKELQKKLKIQKNESNTDKKIPNRENGSKNEKNFNNTDRKKKKADEETEEKVENIIKYIQSMQKTSEETKPSQQTNEVIKMYNFKETVSSNEENANSEEDSSEEECELYESYEDSFEESSEDSKKSENKSYIKIDSEHINKPKSEYKVTNKGVLEDPKTSTPGYPIGISKNFDEKFSTITYIKQKTVTADNYETNKDIEQPNLYITSKSKKRKEARVKNTTPFSEEINVSKKKTTDRFTTSDENISHKLDTGEDDKRISSDKTFSSYSKSTFSEIQNNEHFPMLITSMPKIQTFQNRIKQHKKADEKASKIIQTETTEGKTNKNSDVLKQTNKNTSDVSDEFQKERLDYTTSEIYVLSTSTPKLKSSQNRNKSNTKSAETGQTEKIHMFTNKNNNESEPSNKSVTDVSEESQRENLEYITPQINTENTSLLEQQASEKEIRNYKKSDKKNFKTVQADKMDIETQGNNDVSKQVNKSESDVFEESKEEKVKQITLQVNNESTSTSKPQILKKVIRKNKATDKNSSEPAQIERTSKITNDNDSKQPYENVSDVSKKSEEHLEYTTQKMKVQTTATLQPQTLRNRVTTDKKSNKKTSEKVQTQTTGETTNEINDESTQTKKNISKVTAEPQEENPEYTTPQTNIENTFTLEYQVSQKGTKSSQKSDENSSKIVQKDTMDKITHGSNDLKQQNKSELDESQESQGKKQEYTVTKVNNQNDKTPKPQSFENKIKESKKSKNVETEWKSKAATDGINHLKQRIKSTSGGSEESEEHESYTTQQIRIQTTSTLKPQTLQNKVLIPQKSDKNNFKSMQTETTDRATNESSDSKQTKQRTSEIIENSEKVNPEYTTPEINIESTTISEHKTSKQVTNNIRKSDENTSKIGKTGKMDKTTQVNNADGEKQPTKNALDVTEDVQKEKLEYTISQVNIHSTLKPKSRIFQNKIKEHRKPSEKSSEIIQETVTNKATDDTDDNLKKPSTFTSNASGGSKEHQKDKTKEINIHITSTHDPQPFQKVNKSQKKSYEKPSENTKILSSNENSNKNYNSEEAIQTINISDMSEKVQEENVIHTTQQGNIKKTLTPEYQVQKRIKTQKKSDNEIYKTVQAETTYKTLDDNDYGFKKTNKSTSVVSKELQEESLEYRTTKINIQNSSTTKPSTVNNDDYWEQPNKNVSNTPEELQEEKAKYTTLQLNIQSTSKLKPQTLQNKAKSHNKPEQRTLKIQQSDKTDEINNEDNYNTKQVNENSSRVSKQLKEEKLEYTTPQVNTEISSTLKSETDDNNDEQIHSIKSTSDVYKKLQEKTEYIKQKQSNNHILNYSDELRDEEFEFTTSKLNIPFISTAEPQTFQNEISEHKKYEKSSIIMPTEETYKTAYDSKNDLKQPNKSASDMPYELQENKQETKTSELNIQSIITPYILQNNLKIHKKLDEKSSEIEQTEISDSITLNNNDSEQRKIDSINLIDKVQEEKPEYAEPQFNIKSISSFKSFKYGTEDLKTSNGDISKTEQTNILGLITDDNYKESEQLTKNSDSSTLLKEGKQDYLVPQFNMKNTPVFKNRIKDHKETNKNATEMVQMKKAVSTETITHDFNEDTKQPSKNVPYLSKKPTEKNIESIKLPSKFQIFSNEKEFNESPIIDQTNFFKFDHVLETPVIIKSSSHEISQNTSNTDQIILKKPIINPLESLLANQYPVVEEFVDIPIISNQFKEDESQTPPHTQSFIENFENEKPTDNSGKISQENSFQLTNPFLHHILEGEVQNSKQQIFQDNFSDTAKQEAINNHNIYNEELVNKSKHTYETVKSKTNMAFTTPPIAKVPYISSEKILNNPTNVYPTVISNSKEEYIPQSFSIHTSPHNQIKNGSFNDKNIIATVAEEILPKKQENIENIIDLQTKTLKEQELFDKEIHKQSEQKFKNQLKSLSEYFTVKGIQEEPSTKLPLDQNIMHSITNIPEYSSSSGIIDFYEKKEMKETTGVNSKTLFITTNSPTIKDSTISETPLASSHSDKVTLNKHHEPFVSENTLDISDQYVTFGDPERSFSDLSTYKTSNEPFQATTPTTTTVNEISKNVSQIDNNSQSHFKNTNGDHKNPSFNEIANKIHEIKASTVFADTNTELEDDSDNSQYSSESESFESDEDSEEYSSEEIESAEEKHTSMLDIVLFESTRAPSIAVTEEEKKQTLGTQRSVVNSVLSDSITKSPFVTVTEEDKEVENSEEKNYRTQKSKTENILFDSTKKFPIITITNEGKEANNSKDKIYDTRKPEMVNTLFDSTIKEPSFIIEERNDASRNKKKLLGTQSSDMSSILFGSTTTDPVIAVSEEEEKTDYYKKENTFTTQKSEIDSIFSDSKSQMKEQNISKTGEAKEAGNRKQKTLKTQVSTKDSTFLDTNSIKEEVAGNEEEKMASKKEKTFQNQNLTVDSTLFDSISTKKELNTSETGKEEQVANKKQTTFETRKSMVDSTLLDSNQMKKESNIAETVEAVHSKEKTSEIQKDIMGSTLFDSSSTKKEQNVAIINEEKEVRNIEENSFEIQRSEEDFALFDSTTKVPDIAAVETEKEQDDNNKKNIFGSFLEFLYSHSNSSFFKSLKGA